MKSSQCSKISPEKGGKNMRRAIILLASLAVLVLAISVVSAGPYTVNQNLRLRVSSMTYNQANNNTDVTIAWDNPNPGVTTGYHVYKTTQNFLDPSFSWASLSGGDKDLTPNASTTTKTFNGADALTAFRNYFIRVVAWPGGQETILRVYPPDKIPHGNYAEDTNMCLNCHQTHTGQAPRLLRAASAVELCGTCHDGTGSKYNVKDGGLMNPDGVGLTGYVYSRTDGLNGEWGLLGGAFGEFNPTGNSNPAGDVTSNHTMGKAFTNAPGQSNTFLSGATLSCVSCHNPHGTTNYRILNAAIGTGGYNVNVTAIAYTPTAGDVLEQRLLYGTYDANGVTGGTVSAGIMTLCRGCHEQFQLSRSGSSNVGVGTYPDVQHNYRHAVGISVYQGRKADGAPYGQQNIAIPDGSAEVENRTVSSLKLPLENPSNQGPTSSGVQTLASFQAGSKDGDRINCLTCHYAHGTKKTGNNPVTQPSHDLTVGGGNTIDSLRDEDQVSSAKASTVLKRMNNMGVCEACHYK